MTDARPPLVEAALARWPERFALVLVEEDGSVSWASPAVTEVLGYQPEELVGRSPVEMLHPDDLADAVAVLAQNFERERVRGEAPEPRFLYEVRLRRRDGSWCTAELSGVEGRHPDGAMAVVLCVRDFSQRRLLDDLLALVAESAPLAEVLVAAAEAAEFVVPGGRAAIVAGTGEGRLVGTSPGWAQDPGPVPEPDEALSALVVEHGLWMAPLRSPGGSPGAVVIRTSQPVPAAYQAAWLRRVAQIAGLALERAETEARLRRLALTDPLTEVANRAELGRRLAQACEAGPVAVAIVDLDRFKAVNDGHGHAVGDAYLVEIARRLLRHVRPGDLVGRLGGDEFAVVCPGLDDPGVAGAVAARLVEALGDPVHVDGLLLRAGASVGMALGRAGVVPDALLKQADVLLYEAKRLGGGCHVVGTAG